MKGTELNNPFTAYDLHHSQRFSTVLRSVQQTTFGTIRRLELLLESADHFRSKLTATDSQLLESSSAFFWSLDEAVCEPRSTSTPKAVLPFASYTGAQRRTWTAATDFSLNSAEGSLSWQISFKMAYKQNQRVFRNFKADSVWGDRKSVV